MHKSNRPLFSLQTFLSIRINVYQPMRLGYSMLVMILIVLFYHPQTAAMIIYMTCLRPKSFIVELG